MTPLTSTLGERRSFPLLQRYGPLVLLLVFAIGISLINPSFLSPRNIRNILIQVPPVGVVALGAMFVLLTGGIDLSAGVGLALAGVSAGVVFGETHNGFLMVITALAVGALIGLANGIIITRVGLQPFVATLGMMSVAQGLVYVVSSGRVVFLSGRIVDFIGKGSLVGIPVPFLILLVVYGMGYVALNKTKLGVYALAIGGNEEGTRLAGVKIDLYKLYVYTLAGICTGIGALIMICRISMVAPNIGSNVLLDAIASAVIGGTSISGGKGTVQGTFVGALLIGMISNALNVLNVPPVLQDVVKGVIIVIALYFDVAVTNRRRK